MAVVIACLSSPRMHAYMAYGVENSALLVPHLADARRPGFDRGEAFLFSLPPWLVFCGRMCISLHSLHRTLFTIANSQLIKLGAVCGFFFVKPGTFVDFCVCEEEAFTFLCSTSDSSRPFCKSHQIARGLSDKVCRSGCLTTNSRQ